MKQDFLINSLQEMGLRVPDFLCSAGLESQLNSVEFELPSETHFRVYLSNFQQRHSNCDLFPVAKSMLDDDVVAISYERNDVFITQFHDYTSPLQQNYLKFVTFEDWFEFAQQAS